MSDRIEPPFDSDPLASVQGQTQTPTPQPATKPPSDSIDPDALGDVMAHLAALARDLREHGIATTIDIRIVIAVPGDE